MGKEFLQHMILGKPARHMQRNEDSSIIHTQKKKNSKWIKTENVRLETVRLLERKMGKGISDTGCGNDCLNNTLKTQAVKAKIKSSNCNFNTLQTAEEMTEIKGRKYL